MFETMSMLGPRAAVTAPPPSYGVNREHRGLQIRDSAAGEAHSVASGVSRENLRSASTIRGRFPFAAVRGRVRLDVVHLKLSDLYGLLSSQTSGAAFSGAIARKTL